MFLQRLYIASIPHNASRFNVSGIQFLPDIMYYII